MLQHYPKRNMRKPSLFMIKLLRQIQEIAAFSVSILTEVSPMRTKASMTKPLLTTAKPLPSIRKMQRRTTIGEMPIQTKASMTKPLLTTAKPLTSIRKMRRRTTIGELPILTKASMTKPLLTTPKPLASIRNWLRRTTIGGLPM